MNPKTAILREALLGVLKARCLREGRFVLKSGVVSPYYLDLRMATLSPAAFDLVGSVLYHAVRANGGKAVGGPAVGAVPLVSAVVGKSAAMGEEAWVEGFYTRQPKGHGTDRWVEACPPPGTPVVLVEDVVTSGGSLLESVRAARAAGLDVRAVVPLVDRLAGAREAVLAAGVAAFEPVYTVKDFGLLPDGDPG